MVSACHGVGIIAPANRWNKTQPQGYPCTWRRTMQVKEIEYNGACVYWSLSDGTPIDVVEQGFKALGLVGFLPRMTNDAGALARALRTHFPSSRTLLRSIDGSKGYAVVHEHDDKGVGKMQYREEVRVSFDSAGGLTFTPANPLFDMGVRESYRVESGKMSAAKLGTVLVRCAQSMGGIPLRPRGGFYWMPEGKMSKWAQVAEIVAGANRGNKSYALKTTADVETLSAVSDALKAQVTKRLEAVEASLQSDDSGRRALASNHCHSLLCSSAISRRRANGATKGAWRRDPLGTLLALRAITRFSYHFPSPLGKPLRLGVT